MSSMRRVLKKLDRYVCAADVFEIYEEETGIAFLDSSLVNNLGHYSIIGRCPYLRLVKNGDAFEVNGDSEKDITFEEYMRQYLVQHMDKSSEDLPIVSGAIGYVSYDYGMDRMGLDSINEDLVSVPEAVMTFYDCFVVEDCLKKETYLVANGMTGDAQSNIDVMENDIEKYCGRDDRESGNIIGRTSEDIQKRKKYNLNVYEECSREEYEHSIRRLKDYITEGDVYVANMTRHIVVDSDKKPLDVFRDLRVNNPSPFGGYLDLGDYQIVSASPERFMQIKDRRVYTRPIKGTRRRGETDREDEALRGELEKSQKEKSELLMIVDLERNDLNRVCRPGSVKVTELFSIEEYATVFHQVANVEGMLQDGEDVMSLLTAAFPGGSVTGAPKRRAMEITDELECGKRNIYTGSIGYITLDGKCDFNIVIRTVLYRNGRYYLGVGGGITADSDPGAEYEETRDKAKAILSALQ